MSAWIASWLVLVLLVVLVVHLVRISTLWGGDPNHGDAPSLLF
jgi:hypothetical protein